MVKISMVQGRLSSEVAGKYQYFPIHNWRNEFKEAKKLGFDGIEWIISDFSNPIFDSHGRKQIQDLIKSTGIQITSISLDLLMPKTLDKFSDIEISWIFKEIDKLAKEIKLCRVSIPIEETCGIRDPLTLKAVQSKLIKIFKKYATKNYNLAIETDMSPQVIKSFLSHKDLKECYVLLDIGNSAAYGYKLKSYFDLIPNKIISLHIKDRSEGIGSSVPLGQGSAEFKFLYSNLKKLKKLKDIALQTFKTNNNYYRDIRKAKEFLDNILGKVL